MANKNTGVDRDSAASRMDEQVVNRESVTPIERGDEYGSPDTSVGAPKTSTGTAMDDSASTRGANQQARTREIRAEIEQTRDKMSDTVNTIQERLRPGTIASNAVDSVREAATEGVREIAESEPVRYARANAIPSVMVGIGLAGAAWLAFGGQRPSPSRYRGRNERYYAWEGDESDSYDAAKFTYGGSNRDRYSRDFRRGTESTAEYARQRVASAQNQLQQTWDRNPLLLGAAAGILGAIIGSLVPESDRENELMGPARDSMVEGVEQAVQNKVEQVQDAATKAVNDVQQAVGITSSDESPSSNPPAGGSSQPPRKTGSKT